MAPETPGRTTPEAKLTDELLGKAHDAGQAAFDEAIDNIALVPMANALGLTSYQLAQRHRFIAERAVLLQALVPGEAQTCAWTPDEDGIFYTGCGHAFYFDGDGGPVEHKQKFCGYCGAALIEMPLEPRDE